MSTAQPVVIEPAAIDPADKGRLLFMAEQLANEYARLSCERLTAGLTKDALYMAEWQKALSALAAGVDAGKITFPVSRP